MTADKFGCRVNNNICSVFNRPYKIRCGKGIIHNQRNLVCMGDVRNLLNIDHIRIWITQSFNMNCLCVFLNGRFDFFIIKWVYKSCCDSILRQCVGQQVVCTAVNIFSRYNVVSRMGQILKCIRYGRCSGSHRQSCHTTFKRCDTLFKHIFCRVC